MTDKEIIQALEICTEGIYICDKDCPYYDVKSDTRTSYCKFELLGDALDLINRQQAENEKMKVRIDAFDKAFDEVFPPEMIEKAKEMAGADNG